MQLNKVLKGLLIALPVMAMSACSSSDDATDASGSQTNQQQTSQSSKSADTEDTMATPMESSESQMSEEEAKNQALREKQTVYFAFDNSTISSDYEDMLEAHASYLSEHPNMSVKIEGYTDERGTPEYNIALGERRAKAVEKYLEALGVEASQISIVSYGEEKPLVLGQSQAAYAKNRRAVLVY
ncbi:peptidoglycan-associated lipoprotein Pal [Vibrio palustris]|uniref:Peptidoglycan-associated lipoprotein n=1 Tax=Vibrio palustris TaxID=1918946 RepID=A0A1R4B1X4_9VIBR|nr:peptidoglycan-associated lipoprotein Pal [Vibrio palustris]SJL82919.1 Peptidoglycan-associated lipoprotein precursor [Vibrio palustris]